MDTQIIPFRFNIKGISKADYQQNARILRERQRHFGDPDSKHITVFLVPEPENPVDPYALTVMAPTPVGRLQLGYAPARRYCLHCDPELDGYGHAAYASGLDGCPQCRRELTSPYNLQMLPLLLRDDVAVQSSALFIGGDGGKKTIGAICVAEFNVPVLVPVR